MPKRSDRSMVGARVMEFKWDECLDGASAEESMFYVGYLEVYIFGTGEHTGFEAHKFWHLVCACTKFDTVWSSDFDHGFLLILNECGATYENLLIAEGQIAMGNKITTVQTAIIDFRLKDRSILKKIILLHPDGTASEIPDETLQ